MKIIYRNQNDAQRYDEDRFIKSLKEYDSQVKASSIRKALEPYANNDVLHVSVLVETGVKLLPEEAAKEYYEDHAEWFEEGKFERLRRITGYLVGTLDRWNDAKKAEEAARVKHSVNSSIDDAERLAALETQAMEQNYAYSK